jgi:hypothetical protein
MKEARKVANQSFGLCVLKVVWRMRRTSFRSGLRMRWMMMEAIW